MWGWSAFFIQIYKNQLLYGDDGLPGHLVAYLTAEGYRTLSKFSHLQPDLDDVALLGGAHKVYFRHVLGDNTLIFQLDDHIKCGLLIYPLQKATAKKGTIGIEVFRLDPFTGVEVHILDLDN